MDASTKRGYTVLERQIQVPRPKPTLAEIKEDPTLCSGIVCLICHERKQPADINELPCRHRHCNGCVRNQVRDFLDGKTDTRPGCCKRVIPTNDIHLFIPLVNRRAYTDRVDEVATPHTKRWYCPAASCRKWIRPAELRLTGSIFSRSRTYACPHCNALICYRCRGRNHGGKCPAAGDRPEMQGQFLLADKEGWQQCYRCCSLVEKSDGCQHIKCLCGAHFCYLCGRKSSGYCVCWRNDTESLVSRKLKGAA
ncbi:hypothetical protein BDW59DRAFT_104586 [Aspergillus cavernicola]|uniref:RBR-type E3 ubiquitin transferase n=1 Tax=Aspergillus cavernicola TaxID=176166 RepID=A0ABR4IXA8_9EURO